MKCSFCGDWFIFNPFCEHKYLDYIKEIKKLRETTEELQFENKAHQITVDAQDKEIERLYDIIGNAYMTSKEREVDEILKEGFR